jgi:DNA-binding SARP family transcriptional activator
MDTVHPPETAKATFDLVTLGTPALRDAMGQSPAGLGSGKPLALLCFLVVRREVRRDEALALLWGDVDEDRARNAFRQALHRLRLALGEDLVGGDRQLLRIVLDYRLRADIIDFESAVDQDRLDDALALYRGDFLDGFDVGSLAFDEWAETERLRLKLRCKTVAERATQRALIEGRTEDAESAVRKLLDVAPQDSGAVEVAASSLVSLGRRDQAVEVLTRFRLHAARDAVAVPKPLETMLERLAPSASGVFVSETPRETDFVGRGAELARLAVIWHSVGEESGATVAIEAPSGAGKSRLVRELALSIQALGDLHWLHGVEGPRGFTAPYAGLVTALRPLVRAPGVAGASPHLLAEAARLLPELRDAFQLPPVEALQEDTARLRLCEGVAALVEAAAYERPVCLVLEDVHRAASATLELLGYMASRLRRARVLILFTFDPDDVSPPVASRLRSLAGTPAAGREIVGDSCQLSLSPLSADETTALILQVLGPSTAAERARMLADRAGGNPLKAIELARLSIDGREPSLLPVHTNDIIRERIRACSSTERRLLLAASLLSRAAPLRLLAEASHVAAVAAEDAAQSLKRRALLTETGTALAPSSDTTATTSLELAGESTTTFVAGWVAEALGRERDSDAGEVARLYALAGRMGETHRWAREAAERALARGGTEEALYFLRVAREFARTSAESAAVESLLAAHGAGRVLLRESSQAEDGRDRVVAALKRSFPNWRYLTGVAIATTAIAIFLSFGTPTIAVSPTNMSDTLAVARINESRQGLIRLVTAGRDGDLNVSEAVPRNSVGPSWLDSLELPWVNPMPSPNRRFVGVERVTPTGTQVFIVSADRRDTIPIAVGDTEAFGMGWSPDGEKFLVTRRRSSGGESQLGLFAFSMARHGPGAGVPIDTSANHSVTEAAWSPDGSHVAWVARVQGGQEEVLVSWADGTHRQNLSRHPAQDYNVAWSPDGSLVAFTSRRDGNAELYAYDLLNHRLWRLTDNRGQDDRAAFTADGRLVAFESTRDGASDVYIMPSLGGATARVGDSISSYEIVGWRRSATRYLDRLEIAVPAQTRRGDTVELRARGLDQFDAALAPWQAQWSVVDATLLEPVAVDSAVAPPTERRFVARRDGLARVVVSVNAWRADTAFVKIGDGRIELVHDDFIGRMLGSAWRALGQPSPTIGSVPGDNSALLVNADRQWESGVLGSPSIPVQAGLTVEAALSAPFGPQARTTASIALVARDPPDAIDSLAPRFLRLISATWNAEAGRFIYAAGRDVFAEAVPAGPEGSMRTLSITVNADGTVTFLVDGSPRWRSTLRVLRPERVALAQIWLGGQETGGRVGFGKVSVTLDTPR